MRTYLTHICDWLALSVRDTSKLPLSMWGIIREMETLRQSACGCRTRSFSNLLAVAPCGVMRLTYHLLGLYSDQICSTCRWILSQWDSWVLVTTLQCFINRDSCVIHLPGLLAGGHVMSVDHCGCILDWDFCPGKFCCSLFLKCPPSQAQICGLSHMNYLIKKTSPGTIAAL